MIEKQKSIALTFSNYNYAFANFYESYKNQCLIISEKTLLGDIKEIRQIISSFIYEYDYAIHDNNQRIKYREDLNGIKRSMDNDADVVKIIHKDPSIISNKVQYHRKYYYYLLKYLEVLGGFASELTSTFMPNTNIQRKLIRFSNNQAFFERFTQHKKIILESLSEFSIDNFRKSYNNLLTFYYAYNLFINKESKLTIENLFSLILSIYLSKDNLRILAIPTHSLSKSQRDLYFENEIMLHNALLYCNSKMNQSFSSYDVLPKLQSKIYVDRTLI